MRRIETIIVSKRASTFDHNERLRSCQNALQVANSQNRALRDRISEALEGSPPCGEAALQLRQGHLVRLACLAAACERGARSYQDLVEGVIAAAYA
eukprot:CAMPEP_0206262874 /NCGR_PEP_ID=MMETSP0047_2-20121206/28500_1 /ASSEMBLY_ACC=CAM_ASM_000192 /TAXON_ID=195065 /ORGANISM="Chroomonas mesostigmatica_cf, Strain CCMP1168" /LENGTH=95 /DNA_ID=CAMNT_0053690343 /DNA_START=11 /DNA_END=295 /DNA_ORIENTATION=+